jgi:hyaluronan synthase
LALQNKAPLSTEKYRELDKKRWLVRYLILASIAIILGIKLYLRIYVIDFTVGINSFLTSFILFKIFFISYVKYRDPFIKARGVFIPEDRKPLVSIMVPVKNEEGNIRNCVRSCLDSTYSNKEIIIVDDGSRWNSCYLGPDEKRSWPWIQTHDITSFKKHRYELSKLRPRSQKVKFML